ncbi:MAG: RNA-binding S4 domain-containing protein [Pseudomonadota bacterium]
MTTVGPGQRIDKWLWFARVVKTRSLAAGLVEGGGVRVNKSKTTKPSHIVRAGDVLTIVAHHRVRVLKVLEPGNRRGPAVEAQLLYEDLSPPPEQTATSPTTQPVGDAAAISGQRPRGSSRPTKRDRRKIDALRRAD